MTPTNEEVRLRLYAAYWDMSLENATKSIKIRPAPASADRLLTAFLALERERTAGLVEAAKDVMQGIEGWCKQIDEVGTSWDDWDHFYKHFHYNGGLNALRAAFGAYDALKGKV